MTDGVDARARPTIADVARTAGVSVPTVSKVLDDRTDVSADTRSRVQDALSSHRYRRRGRGRGPRAPLVELIVNDLDSPYYLEVLRGAEQAAARAGMGLAITATHGETGGGRWLSTLADRRSAGLVLAVSAVDPSAVEQVAALDTPLVLLDSVGGTDLDLPTVGATNWRGGLAATEHLVGLGHRRIAVITGPPSVAASLERLDGHRAALGRAGLPVDERLVRSGDFRPEGGQRAAASLLDEDDPPTAVFAGSDMQASGVYQEARARGLQVPGDLSVVGFDDLSICRYLSPPLTTVRQPLAEMAAQAVRLALEAGAPDQAGAAAHLQLATSLVVRESTAPPAHP